MSARRITCGRAGFPRRSSSGFSARSSAACFSTNRLGTSAGLFRYYLKKFARAARCCRRGGIGEIPRQLAAAAAGRQTASRLPASSAVVSRGDRRRTASSPSGGETIPCDTLLLCHRCARDRGDCSNGQPRAVPPLGTTVRLFRQRRPRSTTARCSSCPPGAGGSCAISSN